MRSVELHLFELNTLAGLRDTAAVSAQGVLAGSGMWGIISVSINNVDMSESQSQTGTIKQYMFDVLSTATFQYLQVRE